jgi:glycine C-acetyltransferase
MTSSAGSKEAEMHRDGRKHLVEQLALIDASGLRKRERILTSAQGAHVSTTETASTVLNMCSNNYLGLANHPEILEAARAALDEYGFGLASVRFICGTQSLHVELEEALSAFLGTEQTILYNSCFDANAGLFETLLGPEDAVISDSLNHASIIDGVRLCKAQRFRYQNADMVDLERQLKNATSARLTLIATDGVFSMDGYYAPLPEICALARKHRALVMVDDSHAVGFVGQGDRGTPEHFGVTDQVDIVTGTLGKALGGGSGGYVSGRAEIIEMLHQRSRPYLFSNTLPPMLVAGASKALEIVSRSAGLREALHRNTQLLSGPHCTDGPDSAARHASNCPDYGWRRKEGGRAGGTPSHKGRLRRRLYLPSRAQRTGSDPGTGLSGTLDGRSRIRGHELRRSSARTGNPAGMKSAAVS